MSVHADDWFDLYGMLRERMGEPFADRIMKFLPPTGWPEFATKDDLERLRADMERQFTAATATQIRWVAGLVVPTMIAGIGVSAAVTAALVA